MIIRWFLILIAIVVCNNISFTTSHMIHEFWEFLVALLGSSIYVVFKNFNPKILQNKWFKLRYKNVGFSLWNIWGISQPYLVFVKSKYLQKKQRNTWFINSIHFPVWIKNWMDGRNTSSVADASATC